MNKYPFNSVTITFSIHFFYCPTYISYFYKLYSCSKNCQNFHVVFFLNYFLFYSQSSRLYVLYGQIMDLIKNSSFFIKIYINPSFPLHLSIIVLYNFKAINKTTINVITPKKIYSLKNFLYDL